MTEVRDKGIPLLDQVKGKEVIGAGFMELSSKSFFYSSVLFLQISEIWDLVLEDPKFSGKPTNAVADRYTTLTQFDGLRVVGVEVDQELKLVVVNVVGKDNNNKIQITARSYSLQTIYDRPVK